MPEKLKLIVTVDSRDVLSVSKSVLETLGFEVEVCRKDGKELIDKIKTQKPDAVLMEMCMMNYDAIKVLDEINTFFDGKNKPVMIVMSSYNNGETERNVMSAGASYFLLKPFDYGMLAQRIKTMCSFGMCAIRRQPSYIDITDLEIMVTEMLAWLGVPAHLNGYRYIRSSIIMAVCDRSILNGITSKLYPAIAEKYHTTPEKAERSIRNAVEYTWDKGKFESLEECFGNPLKRKKPTNGEFIANLSDKMVINLKSNSINLKII